MRATGLALLMATALVALDAAARELPVEGSLEEVAAQAEIVVVGHRGRAVSRGEFGTRVVQVVVERTLFGPRERSTRVSTATC